jgi:hypothetical protein
MSFFKKGKGGSNMFSETQALSNGEPSPREEVKQIIHGDKRGSWLVYRRVRRDDEGYPMISDEAASNRSSEALFKNNSGLKYLFDDYLIKGYISLDQTYHESGKVIAYGDSRTDVVAVYLEHDVIASKTNNIFDIPDAHDKIIIPQYDIEGRLKSPLAIKEQYDIGSVEPFRLEGTGRLEFVKVNMLSNFNKSHRV